MRLILLSGDLMTMSVAQGAADRHGMQLRVVANGPAAVAACREDGAVFLAVDLRAAGLDVAALMADLRAGGERSVRVLAFGPHVHEASLAAASAAGCDEVVTRGELDRRLDAALERLAHQA